ncbi:hypothetical protein GCM10009865_54820 [Aeromicrobium ponti]
MLSRPGNQLNQYTWLVIKASIPATPYKVSRTDHLFLLAVYPNFGVSLLDLNFIVQLSVADSFFMNMI